MLNKIMNKATFVAGGITTTAIGIVKGVVIETTYETALLGLIKTGAVTKLTLSTVGLGIIGTGAAMIGMAALDSQKIYDAITAASNAAMAAANAATAAYAAVGQNGKKKD